MAVIAAIIGRILIAVLFILAGIMKIVDPSGIIQTLEASKFPGSLGRPIGIFEVVAGLLLVVGLMTRLTSILLFGFTIITVLIAHNDFGDPMQAQMALKNLAIAGGLLMVFAYGQTRGTLDHIRSRDKTHDAELRAARAEGRAEGAEHRVNGDRPRI